MHYQLAFDAWSIEFKGKKIVKNLRKVVCEAGNGPVAKQYWTKKLEMITPK